MSTEDFYDNWDSSVNYAKFDIVNGIASVTENKYYYSTADNNIGQNPNDQYLYRIYSGVRSKDEVTLYVFSTGAAPVLNAGSLFRCVTVDPKANFTGMATSSQFNGGSGWIKYTNAGKNSVFGSGGFAITVLNPFWTTGFFFLPNYSSSQDVKTKTVEAVYGDGYSQRMRDGLNANQPTWNLLFQSRSDGESAAIMNFISDKGGVDAFPILIPVGKLKNQPNTKFIAKDPKTVPDSYGLNSISAAFTRVFDL